MFAGWIPFAMLVIIIAARLGYNRSNLPFVPLVGYMLVWLVLGNVVRAFRCPRCGSRFYALWSWGMGHNPLARKCRNCGLRKWQCDGINNPAVFGA